MAQNQNFNELVVTPEAVAVFPHVFEAKPIMVNGQAQGDPMYSIVLLFSEEDVKGLKKTAANLAQQKWPSRDLKELQFPFKRGESEAQKQADKGRNGEFYRGYIVVKASSKYQPGVVGPTKQDIIDPKEVYSGCIVRAQLNVKTFSAGSNEGVKCYLNHLMKVRDGERLIGTTAQDAFANVEGASTDVDPTSAGGGAEDDDIPW